MDEWDQSRSLRWDRSQDASSSPGGAPAELHVGCIGRERELADLRAQYDRSLSDGSGRVVHVVGPTGIGKSRLLGELLRRLRAEGIPAFEGSARARAAPYQPLIEIAQGVLAFLGEQGARGDSLGRLASTVAALRGQVETLRRGAPRGMLQALPGTTGRLALFERVREVFAELARVRPPVIVIHDLHLADGATLALVEYLARALAPAPGLASGEFVGLLVISQNGAQTAPPPAWLDDVAHAHCPIGGLDLEGVRAFLGSPEFAARVLAATGGHPARLESILSVSPPDAESLAAERVALLSPAAARLAQALAVLGRPAADALLVQLEQGLGLGTHGEAAAELADSPLFVRSFRSGELRLAFAQGVERDAILAGIGADELRALHRAVAGALAEDDPARAEHALAAGGDDAVDAALAAGELLERTFAFERAISLYAAARTLARRPDQQKALGDRLADLYEMMSDYRRAIEAAEQTPVSPERSWRIGHLELMAGDFAKATECLERAELLGGPAPILARIAADLAECHFLAGRHDEARLAGTRAIELAADGKTRVTARNKLGKVALERGDYAEARRLFADNLADARRAGLPFEEAQASVNGGIAALREGDAAAAEQCYRAGLAIATQHGDLRHRGFCLQNLGVLAQWRRDYEVALHCYQEAVAAFQRIGHRPWLAWVAIDLGDLFLGLGAPIRAEAMRTLAARLSGDAPPPTTTVLLDSLGGRIAADRGDAAAARHQLLSARDTAMRIGYREEVVLATFQLARLSLEAGDATGAMAELEGIGRPGTPRLEAQLLLSRGEAELAAGRLAEANADLALAARQFAELADDEGQLRTAAFLAQTAERMNDPRSAASHAQRARELDRRLRARVPSEFATGYGKEPWRAQLVQPTPAVRPVASVVVAEQPRPAPTSRFPKIVGASSEISHLFDFVERVAPSESTVLLRGESGTGKELVAEAIHELSARRGRPFIRVNCGALVDSLLLSELFGHERGAFTGALSRKKGRFELADGGTLFLDEIGDISAHTQVALLRVLQTREFERVGGTQPVRVDVRIVCATNRDLEAMVTAGRFREDLYYRLKGVEIELPPLRNRLGDLLPLGQHFLAQIGSERQTSAKRLAPSAVALLGNHSWPGNVRELENVLRSATLFVDGEEVEAVHLAPFLGVKAPPEPAQRGAAPARPTLVALPPPPPAAAKEPVDADKLLGEMYRTAVEQSVPLRELKRRLELECITRALADAGGNITRAAERLGMKRPRLSQLLKEHGIGIGSQKSSPEDEE